jgi:hypothetical protein
LPLGRTGAVYLLGADESVETPMVSLAPSFPRKRSRKRGSRAARVLADPPCSRQGQALAPRFPGGDEKNTSSRVFRVAGPKAFAQAGITHNDVDHLMIDDAPCSLPGAGFAHLPIYGLKDLGFVPRGEAGAFIAERNTAPGGKLPLNTNGGGLSYMHSGMYGMYALQESVRQMRGTAPAQIPARRSPSATASAACSPRRAPTSCRTSRRKGRATPSTRENGPSAVRTTESFRNDLAIRCLLAYPAPKRAF